MNMFTASLLNIVIGDYCVLILSVYNVCFSTSDFLVLWDDKYKEQLRNHSQAVSCNFFLLRSKFAHHMFIFTCFFDSDVKKKKGSLIQSNLHKYNKQAIPHHSVNHFSRCYLGHLTYSMLNCLFPLTESFPIKVTWKILISKTYTLRDLRKDIVAPFNHSSIIWDWTEMKKVNIFLLQALFSSLIFARNCLFFLFRGLTCLTEVQLFLHMTDAYCFSYLQWDG